MLIDECGKTRVQCASIHHDNFGVGTGWKGGKKARERLRIVEDRNHD